MVLTSLIPDICDWFATACLTSKPNEIQEAAEFVSEGRRTILYGSTAVI
jgi:hypothetical protein